MCCWAPNRAGRTVFREPLNQLPALYREGVVLWLDRQYRGSGSQINCAVGFVLFLPLYVAVCVWRNAVDGHENRRGGVPKGRYSTTNFSMNSFPFFKTVRLFLGSLFCVSLLIKCKFLFQIKSTLFFQYFRCVFPSFYPLFIFKITPPGVFFANTTDWHYEYLPLFNCHGRWRGMVDSLSFRLEDELLLC